MPLDFGDRKSQTLFDQSVYLLDNYPSPRFSEIALKASVHLPYFDSESVTESSEFGDQGSVVLAQITDRIT